MSKIADAIRAFAARRPDCRCVYGRHGATPCCRLQKLGIFAHKDMASPSCCGAVCTRSLFPHPEPGRAAELRSHACCGAKR